jgi:hypothetical protein
MYVRTMICHCCFVCFFFIFHRISIHQRLKETSPDIAANSHSLRFLMSPVLDHRFNYTFTAVH